ncbi:MULTISPECIES: copper chaperone PCu(A)C [unclassified Bradyrhizobium]|uniref:copper chaperone PCu(A)C n=1 Tax=unclassified Bradyrhizobium TaxID=2631580 RepID=UPI001BA72355|nr:MULTISPECIES: copper chaperone PCu(A)C [unclassified Bradyrhizobium]MBR1203711.1 copper chaperone PCu(A)C [Bradyrhizobium sp. AUGA SZCCT0124]MBR1310402.1 copper chaperone PCu(A)C [Bradyrhizobium sp. AUGA SZCCT0051]MBR1340545.1 copper chaperone PCu(A)C [Bradyrhizobium sp. AUGA SZCCT0105]MBR1355151.1 copper chaperone PCu(A)C [Bradyrhizobium sp. AUGA SZCCT0045]
MLKVASITLVAVALLAFTSSAPSLAEHERVAVSQAWTRATPKGAKVAGGYLTVENRGTRADRLLSAESPAAGKEKSFSIAADGMSILASANFAASPTLQLQLL